MHIQSCCEKREGKAQFKRQLPVHCINDPSERDTDMDN